MACLFHGWVESCANRRVGCMGGFIDGVGMGGFIDGEGMGGFIDGVGMGGFINISVNV